MRLFRSPSGTTQRASVAPAGEEAVLGALMIQVSRGNEAAFGQLYDILSPLVYGVILRVVRNPAMSEEVAQEVFVELWKIAPRFDTQKGSAKGWAATVAHRRAVDRVRSEEARVAREEREHRDAPMQVDVLAEVATDHFELRRIHQAMTALTEGQREAIELAYYGGRTHREVAQMLDAPVGTIKTRIRDGLIKVRDQLGVEA